VVVSAGLPLQAGQPQGVAAKTMPLLYDRVRAMGSHLDETLDAGDVPYASLAELASRAPVIVIGRTRGLRSRLAADEVGIATEIALSVQECLKGPVPPGSLIYFRVPGGFHRFPDGRTARQALPGFRAVRTDATYVLFLRPIPPAQGTPADVRARRTSDPYRAEYELAAGDQGRFELQVASGTVVPAPGGMDHPLVSRYAGMSVTDFLVELSRAVAR
jgi:hypothetical protein